MRASPRGVAATLLPLILLTACAPNGDMPDVEEPELVAAVQATVENGSALFELRVTNPGDEPVELEFSSGQRYDFIVRRDGSEIWRWSEGMMFTQALESETLEPGETLAFAERWTPSDAPEDELVVVGELTSTSHPLRQETVFRFR